MTTVAKKKDVAPAKARSLDEFRSSHDRSYIVPNKIRAALAALGSDGWAYEGEFVKLATISLTELGAYREQFQEFIVTLKGTEHGGRRAWAGSKATAEKMRRMVS